MNDEESAAVVVRHLERLSGQWLGVLQEPVYAKLTGYLLEGVVRDAIAPVIKADCISEAAATDISRLFRTIGRAKLDKIFMACLLAYFYTVAKIL